MTSKEIFAKNAERCLPCVFCFKAEEEIQIMNDLKVLEILKDKLPHITILRVMDYEDTYEFYNDINITSITKEEYELLKEWLNG